MGTGSNLDTFIIVQVVSCRLTSGNFGFSDINKQIVMNLKKLFKNMCQISMQMV